MTHKHEEQARAKQWHDDAIYAEIEPNHLSRDGDRFSKRAVMIDCMTITEQNGAVKHLTHPSITAGSGLKMATEELCDLEEWR